jgi:hypothetical protein
MNELQSLRDELAAAKASSQTTEASTHTQSQDQSSNSTQYERVAPAEENHVACGPDNTAAEVVDHSAMFQEMMKSNVSVIPNRTALDGMSNPFCNTPVLFLQFYAPHTLNILDIQAVEAFPRVFPLLDAYRQRPPPRHRVLRQVPHGRDLHLRLQGDPAAERSQCRALLGCEFLCCFYFHNPFSVIATIHESTSVYYLTRHSTHCIYCAPPLLVVSSSSSSIVEGPDVVPQSLGGASVEHY